MKKKRQKPWETELIEKIKDVINSCFPEAEEKALKQFKKEKAEEIPLMQSKVDFVRGFQGWFLLKYLIKGKFTPMEFISGNPADYFTKRELHMVDNFLNNEESFYEIVSISEDKKDFTIKNIANSKIILVKTINFPAKLKAGEYISAIPVQKLDGDYFFYGNVACYSKENGNSIKKIFLEEWKKAQREENQKINGGNKNVK
ncbi:hypothetical protein HYT56_04520 [Candidatus Woesearchaeota archaeon]|nr:hypothetical protein [Candidatus Woesearchaeota archaeon]